MAFKIIRNDITQVCADAIVNTANPQPTYAGGTDAAIYRAAGEEKLLAERKKIGVIEVGQAVETPAFQLNARYIIHTVGPEWIDGEHGEYEAVRSCYMNSLKLAKKLGCESIAFPLIATGVYGFPKAEALKIAVSVFSEFLVDEEMQITLVVFDSESFVLSGKLFSAIDSYIDENYVSEQTDAEYSVDHTVCFAGYLSKDQDYYDDKDQDEPGDEDRDESIDETQDGADDEDQDETHDNPRIYGNKDRKSLFFRKQSESKRQSGLNKNSALGKQGVSNEQDITKKRSGLKKRNLFQKQIKSEEHSEASIDSMEIDEAFFEDSSPMPMMSPMPSMMQASISMPVGSLDDIMAHVADTWQESLFRLIDEKGFTDVEVYKRANVDRKLFSKIRSNAAYQPKKITAVAFALALQLNIDQTKDMLARAGYALSPSSKFDLIVRYFIENEVYDTYTINLALFEHDQPSLGE